jgi:polyphosphate kinase
MSTYQYFKRDIRWLSFNHRVLLEAKNEQLPVYERIKFLSIYSSNLDEYYKVRVSGYHDLLNKHEKDEDDDEALQTLLKINRIAAEHEKEYYQIFNDMILPELERNNIILYQSEKAKPFHKKYIENYFNEEVFPYLQPMIVQKNAIHSFILDGHIYQAISLLKKGEKKTGKKANYTYAIMKIPQPQVPRFIELPPHEGKHYIMFIDDVIKANMKSVFPGYEVIDCYSIKISRDADFSIENEDHEDIAKKILRKVRNRKIGAVTRFQYDKNMPIYFLKYLCDSYEIEGTDLLPSGKYLNKSDLMKLPNPVGDSLRQKLPMPLRVPVLETNDSVLSVLRKQDVLLHFPYQSFDYLLRFLMQAAFDPKVAEIKVTQYRVAENSAVINSLISAAKNGKKVTVFVELKARFDEENNYLSSELMQQAGVKIIYSLPGLKVHAKLAYVRKRSNDPNKPLKGYAYLGTGNFNEKTARIYSDKGLLTSNREFIEDIDEVFRVLEGKPHTRPFRHLLIAQFNMLPEIHKMIEQEIENARNGGEGRIVLKMNSIEDKGMINALYRASEAGVQIDLIVRGICCIVPNRPFSKNIRITRIVDAYLEHSRVWYFFNGGEEKVYLTSADFMERNLHRRIEAAFPILSPVLKQQVIDILNIQLADNQSAVWVDENMNNVFKKNDLPPVRAQEAAYRYLESMGG